MKLKELNANIKALPIYTNKMLFDFEYIDPAKRAVYDGHGDRYGWQGRRFVAVEDSALCFAKRKEQEEKIRGWVRRVVDNSRLMKSGYDFRTAQPYAFVMVGSIKISLWPGQANYLVEQVKVLTHDKIAQDEFKIALMGKYIGETRPSWQYY